MAMDSEEIGGNMMEVKQGAPFLRVEYTNSFGDRHEACHDLFDNSVDSIISGVLHDLLSFGFAEGTINNTLLNICDERNLLADYGVENEEDL